MLVYFQLKHYFGDYNLPRDKFLLEQIKGSEGGWIPMETMLKFKRLANLSEDPKAILETVKALESSGLLEVDVEGQKIRRTPEKAVPEWNEERKQDRKAGQFQARRFAHGDARGLTATLTPWFGVGPPPTEWGTSFTLAVGHGHLVLSSTADGAVRVFDGLAAREVSVVRGDVLGLDGAGLARVIDRNRSLLELSRMLDEGETALEAQQFWDSVVAVARELALHVSGSTRGENASLDLIVERRRG